MDGFRFDAAKHIEPEFFTEVLLTVPNTYAFGEVITPDPDAIPHVPDLDFDDFPLVATMKQAFGLNGNFDTLKLLTSAGNVIFAWALPDESQN